MDFDRREERNDVEVGAELEHARIREETSIALRSEERRVGKECRN